MRAFTSSGWYMTHAGALFDTGLVERDRGERDTAAGLLREAVGLYRGALAARPDHYPALRGLGFAHRELGEYREAESVLRRALAREPASAVVLEMLGHVLLRQGRHDEAERHLQNIIVRIT